MLEEIVYLSIFKMNGNVVTTLFLLNTLFSNVELFGHGSTKVTECPKSQSEVREASDRLRCGNDTNGNNQYMCLRYDRHSLIEFCYDGVMGIVDKGNCLEIFEGELKNHSCFYFLAGCPDTIFWFYELYKYPACQNIYKLSNCYFSYVGCPTSASAKVGSSVFLSIAIWIGICSSLFICFSVGFIKAKRHLKGGKWSPHSPDLFSMEAGVYTPTQLEPSIPPPAPPPPPSNT